MVIDLHFSLLRNSTALLLHMTNRVWCECVVFYFVLFLIWYFYTCHLNASTSVLCKGSFYTTLHPCFIILLPCCPLFHLMLRRLNVREPSQTASMVGHWWETDALGIQPLLLVGLHNFHIVKYSEVWLSFQWGV